MVYYGVGTRADDYAGDYNLDEADAVIGMGSHVLFFEKCIAKTHYRKCDD